MLFRTQARQGQTQDKGRVIIALAVGRVPRVAGHVRIYLPAGVRPICSSVAGLPRGSGASQQVSVN